MKRASPTKDSLVGQRFGKLTVILRSDKRASRGARTVPLWECLCDCGNVTYKATDTLISRDNTMCKACADRYATSKMNEKAGYVDGTQISRIRSDKPISTNTSGARGVYYSSKTGKWRARLRFKGKMYNLGSYKSFEDALKARKQAEKEIFGSFLEAIGQ